MNKHDKSYFVEACTKEEKVVLGKEFAPVTHIHIYAH